MYNEDRLHQLEQSLSRIESQIGGLVPVRLADSGGGASRSINILRGTVYAGTRKTAATFQLTGLVLVAGALPTLAHPDDPLTVKQVFPVGYVTGQQVLAIKASNGDWINTPDAGKVLVNGADEFPDTLFDSIVDNTTAFDEELHQKVNIAAVDAGGGSVQAKLFTDKVGGGSGSGGGDWRFVLVEADIAAAAGNASSFTPPVASCKYYSDLAGVYSLVTDAATPPTALTMSVVYTQKKPFNIASSGAKHWGLAVKRGGGIWTFAWIDCDPTTAES